MPVTRLPVANAARVEIIGLGPSGHSMTGYGVALTGPLDEATALALAADCVSNIVNVINGMMSTHYEMQTILVHDTLIPQVTSVPVAISGGASGTIDANIEAASTAPILSLRSTHAGRSYRGRMFVPAIPGEEVLNDNVSGGVQTVMAAVAAALEAIHTRLPEAELGVISYKLGAVIKVVTILIRTIIGTQRKRKEGVGT